MYSISNSILGLSYLSYSRSAAILVHDACTLADTTIRLTNIIKSALLEPCKTQNCVRGHSARISGSAAFVCQSNGRRYPNGRGKTRQTVKVLDLIR